MFGKKNRKMIHRAANPRKRALPTFIVIIVLIVLSIVCTVTLSSRYYRTVMRNYAADVTERIHNNVNMALESGFEVLETLNNNRDLNVPPGSILSNIHYFSGGDIPRELKILHVDGSRCIAYSENMIYLAIIDERRDMIIGEFDQDRLKKILGGAFTDWYGYALVDNTRGLFILNGTRFSSDNYYDSLLELKDPRAVSEILSSKVTQVRFKGPDNKYYYIAQKSDSPCGIVLVFSQDILASAKYGDFTAMIPGFVGMVVLLIALIVCIILSWRLLRYERTIAAAGMVEWREMAETVALRNNWALFVADLSGRDSNEIVYYYGNMLLSDSEEVLTVSSLAELERRLNVDISESGKLLNVLSSMHPGDVVEIELHCMLSTGNRCVHVEMHCGERSGGRIICCAYDSTEEENLRRTELSEAEYIEEMRPRAELIWHINIDRNRWKPLYSHLPGPTLLFGDHPETPRRYDEDLITFVNRYIIREDRDAYEETMTCEALRRNYYDGKKEFSADYRVMKTGATKPSWIRFITRIWQDPANHHLKADVITIDINEQKRAEIERRDRTVILDKSLTAINSVYFGLFYTNLNTGMCYAAKPYRGTMGDSFCNSHKELFDAYIRENVHPDDQQKLIEVLDPWYIVRTIVEDTHLLQVRYRSRLGDNYYWSTLNIQAARFENGRITEVVIALQRMHDADTSRSIAEE